MLESNLRPSVATKQTFNFDFPTAKKSDIHDGLIHDDPTILLGLCHMPPLAGTDADGLADDPNFDDH